MRGITGWLEQWQVPLYLVAIALGAGFGLLLPAVAEPAEHAVTPVLGLLLYTTFLGVPFARLDVPSRRAIVFSGVTRNSLVVLPLVVALPAAYDLAPLVVVTQTLVELLIIVVFIRLVPALLPATVRANSTPSFGISGRASGN